MTDSGTDKRSKRANAEGSVFLWQGRGWYAAVTGPDGRRIMRKAPKQTERGAEQHLRALLAQRDADALTLRSTTLEQFVDEWIRAAKRRNCRPRTLETYREKMALHVVPALGKTRLDRITAAAIDRLYDDLTESGLSPTTVAEVHTRLNSLLKLAKKRRLVPHVVTELVDPPKARKYEARTVTIAEAKHLLRGVAPHRLGTLWTFILGTGCRFGGGRRPPLGGRGCRDRRRAVPPDRHPLQDRRSHHGDDRRPDQDRRRRARHPASPMGCRGTPRAARSG